MAINFFRWKHPCLLSMKRVCSFAYRLICRMSFVYSACLRYVCKRALFAYSLNWNSFTAGVNEWTFSQKTSDLELSRPSHNCVSLSNMADADGSMTTQSKIWKRMVSFKRKLLGNSSILPNTILDMVSQKSQNVLSQQSNSMEMPDYSSGSPKCPKLEQAHNTAADRTVIVVSEDCTPELMAAEEHLHHSLYTSPESLEPDGLPVGDELCALFDSDSQKETNTSSSTTVSSGKKRRKKQKFAKKAGETEKIRPNYFVAIQITNQNIRRKVDELQEYVLTQNKLLKPSMISLPTLHLTLLVMHIADEMQLNRAKVALDECGQAVINMKLELPILCISGIDHFQNAVVFAKVQTDEEFDRLRVIANMTVDHFSQQDLLSEYSDTKGFHPHLTVMKLSKAPQLRKRGIRKLEKSVYEEHIEEFFGHQQVTNLQLCSMTAPKNRETGYYKIMHEVPLHTS